jgi:hypothetical protein
MVLGSTSSSLKTGIIMSIETCPTGLLGGSLSRLMVIATYYWRDEIVEP